MVREMIRPEEEVEILEEDEVITEHSYSVVIHNDDVTPDIIVVHVLISVFGLSPERMAGVIKEAEQKGKAVVKGGYTFSEATEDVNRAKKETEALGFDLKFTIEEEN